MITARKMRRFHAMKKCYEFENSEVEVLMSVS